MELEDQWWKGQLAADIYQALRYKVSHTGSFMWWLLKMMQKL